MTARSTLSFAVLERTGVDAIQRANHASAVAALGTSPAAEALETIRAVRTVLLSTNPEALRRSVGFFGRLLARDITLEAQANVLRGQLGVLARRASAQIQELHHYCAGLAEHSQRLREAADALTLDADGLGAQHVMLHANSDAALAEAAARRIQHLIMLRSVYGVTATHLDLVADNTRDIAKRYDELIPRLKTLLDQDRGIRAGTDLALRISSTHRLIDILDQRITRNLSDTPPAVQGPPAPVSQKEP